MFVLPFLKAPSSIASPIMYGTRLALIIWRFRQMSNALNIDQLGTFLEYTIPQRQPVLIVGAPGVGKTSKIEQVADKLGAEIVHFFPAISDPTDSKGLPVYDSQTKIADFVPFADLNKLVTADKLTIAFADDLGQAPPAVQAAFMQLILARKVGSTPISDHVCWIAATNRKSDRAGVSGILEPVKSRFHSIVELQSELEPWARWAIESDQPTEVIAFMRWTWHEHCADWKPVPGIENTPSPRTIANMGDLFALGLPREIELPAYSGAVGPGCAAQFCGFLEIYRKLPDPLLVVSDPEGTPVPSDDPATMFALCGALAQLASAQTVDALVTYGARMPAEFSVLMMKDAVTRDRTITQSRAWQRWAATQGAQVIL